MISSQYELEEGELYSPMSAEQYYDIQPSKREGFNISVMVIAGWIMFILAAVGLYFAEMKIEAMVVMGLWVVGVILVSPRAGIVLVVAVQVWDIALNPETGGGYDWISPGRVLSILVVFAYFRFMVTRLADIKVCKKSVLFFVGFVLWAIVTMLWADVKKPAIFAVLKMSIQLVITIAGVDLLSDRKILKQMLFLVVAGASSAGLFALFGVISLTVGAETRMTFAGAGVNSLATSLGVAIVGGVGLLLLTRSILAKLVVGACCIAMMLVSLRAGTRSVLVGVPLSLMFGAVLAYCRKIHKVFMLSLVIAVISFGSLYWASSTGFIRGALQERLFSVFQTKTFEENVRWRIWTEALRLYGENPIGVGAGNEHQAYSQSGMTRVREAHNIFLSVLLEYNVVGLGLFVAGFVLLGAALIRVKEPALLFLAGAFLGFLLFSALKGTFHETRMFWQPLMLAMIVIEIDFREQQQLIDEPYLQDEFAEFG